MQDSQKLTSREQFDGHRAIRHGGLSDMRTNSRYDGRADGTKRAEQGASVLEMLTICIERLEA